MSRDWASENQAFSEEVEGRLRFSDPALELRCKEELHIFNIMGGTWTLLYINLAWLTAVILGVVASRIVCGNDNRWPFALGSVGLFAWLVFLALTTAACLRNLRKPRSALYLPLVAFYYVWFLLVSKEPFAVGCLEYIVPDEQCELDPARLKVNATPPWTDTAYFLVRHRFDCSPEANTSLFSMLFLLAFSPRIMLDFRYMWLLWLWVASLGAFILVGRGDYRSEYFNPRETLAKYFVVCVASVEVMIKKYIFEKSQRNVFISDVKQREASQRVFEVLAYMLPAHVLGRLVQHPDAVIAENASCVSILFIMISDFQAHASSMTPKELLTFLNHHFTRIDTICCEHKVTKIETIGEEYVAAVGVEPADVRVNREEGHRVLLGRLLQMATAVFRSEGSEGVEFKMGIHTGPIVAGVIGQKLPRYRLFGDTINTAARMMQKGVVGRCQFGDATRQHLPEGVWAEPRGELEMKGKGIMQVYLMGVPTRPACSSRFAASSSSLPPSPKRASSRCTVPMRSLRPPLVQKILEAESGARLAYHAPDSFFCSSHIPASEQRQAISTMASAPVHAIHWTRGSRPLVQAVVSAYGAAAPASSPLPGSPGRRRRGWAAAPEQEAGARLPSGARRPIQRKFTCVLQEVTTENFPSQQDREDSRSWCSNLIPFYNFFSPEMERDWFLWFHITEICERMPKRLPRQIGVILLATVAECVVMINARTVWAAHGIWKNFRVVVFLSFRGLIFGILGIWYYLSKKHGRYLRFHPRLVQWSLLFSHAVIGLCIFLSYDTLTQPDEVVYCVSIDDCTSKLKESARKSARQSLLTGECWSLVFYVGYSFWMTWQSLLFHHACGVVLITAILMVIAESEVFKHNFYFSVEAKSCFVMCFVIQATIAYTAEKASRTRYKTRCALEFLDERIEDILNTLMPAAVIEELRRLPAQSLSHQYRQMTLAQSDLVGFTKLSSTCAPSRVVEIVSSLFGRFDELTDKYGIYKVETVGDAYIAGQGGWPLTVQNSPLSVVLFALDMVEATAEWASKQQLRVGCRVGVHTGECIGGVVGTEMQRYHIFGAIMSILELLESTAPSGGVQVSRACFEAVAHEMEVMEDKDALTQIVSFEERQVAQLTTSKSEVVEYHQVGGTTYLVVS